MNIETLNEIERLEKLARPDWTNVIPACPEEDEPEKVVADITTVESGSVVIYDEGSHSVDEASLIVLLRNNCKELVRHAKAALQIMGKDSK